MTICKACFEKSSNVPTKFINYLQGFHIIAISKNTSKYDISDSKEDTYHGVPLQQIWILKPIIFLKELQHGFFWS